MMRLTGILLIITLFACQNTKEKTSGKPVKSEGLPEFEFREEFHNFGALQAGEIVAWYFHFTNSGNGPLIIEKYETNCECVEVIFPQKEIAPGQSAYIEVIFNSAGETGRIYQEIKVYANTSKAVQKLAIAATVENELINLYSKN